jgi:FtsP/CotA-like multicopper oxidase with cupredoxin domain
MISYFVWAAACVGGSLAIMTVAAAAALLTRRGHRGGARVALLTTLAAWPVVVLAGGVAFGAGLPLLAGAALALAAMRDAVVHGRTLRAITTDPAPVALLSGAVYAIADIQLLVNRPGPTGILITVLLAVGCAVALRQSLLGSRSATQLGRRLRTAGVATATVAAILLFAIWQGRSSVLPESYSLMPIGHQGSSSQTLAEALQTRNGPHAARHSPQNSTATTPTATADGQGMISVADLRAATTDDAPTRLIVTAQADGDRWTFHPRQLRVAQGDRVQVTVVNRLPESTSVHWHGVNVPGSEDGVPGLTQEAIRPGTSRVYVFDTADAGTFWFHSHQNGLDQIARGMFGALVVLPRGGIDQNIDKTVLLHTWPGAAGVEMADAEGSTAAAVPAGTDVRLRVINTDDLLHRVDLRGTPFRVEALDGHDLSGPSAIQDTAVDVPAGGRVDLSYRQPATLVALRSADASFVTGSTAGEHPAGTSAAVFDAMGYGRATEDTVTRGQAADASFEVVAENRLGWYDGAFGARVALNGRLYPDGDMLMVRQGQLVQVTIINRSFLAHPMHLHGHYFSVVSRNGQPRSGSPLRLDSIEVAPGESVVVAFRADNPGLWMFHCHNGFHAAAGMDLMVGYDGVMTPFRAGLATGNAPQ